MKEKIPTRQIDLFLRGELKFILTGPATEKGNVYSKAVRDLKITVPDQDSLPEDVVIHLLGKKRFRKLQQFMDQQPG